MVQSALAERVREVLLHRVDADVEPVRDLLVAQPQAHQRERLGLPVGEVGVVRRQVDAELLRVPRLLRFLGGRDQREIERLHRTAREPELTGQHGAKRVHDLLGARVPLDATTGAACHGQFEAVRRRRVPQQQPVERWKDLAQVAHRRGAEALGQPRVDEQQARRLGVQQAFEIGGALRCGAAEAVGRDQAHAHRERRTRPARALGRQTGRRTRDQDRHTAIGGGAQFDLGARHGRKPVGTALVGGFRIGNAARVRRTLQAVLRIAVPLQDGCPCPGQSAETRVDLVHATTPAACARRFTTRSHVGGEGN
jgi:hypothetical protein